MANIVNRCMKYETKNEIMKILKVNGLSNRFKQKNRENVVKMKPAGEANALE